MSVVDVVIVGAGIAGLYMLHKLREQNLSVRVIENGADVGGTWFWNRYPGARCDIESIEYSYSFSEELQQEWHWNEYYPSQVDILRYLNHVADKFDLRRDIQFDTRVTAAIFNDALNRWRVQTDRGDDFTARFCVMATGCLSKIATPNIHGVDAFAGRCFFTGRWPENAVDFTGRRVAVIGTGSSGIQMVPMIAEQAGELFVFQRTPNFSVPARNRPMDEEYEREWKGEYSQRRGQMRETPFGILAPNSRNCPAAEVTVEEQWKEYEKQWELGGLKLILTFNDILFNPQANNTAAEFIRSRIRTIVKDPSVAEALLPYNHPFGAKRPCVDTEYFETFNRENVTLVDLRVDDIDEIIPTGVRIKERTYDVDDIIFATGFDAMTGALLNIDIRGRGGRTLKEKWEDGPRTYLGIMMNGFPNLFTITGPGSPSVLTNMFVAIEQHVEWIAECVAYLRRGDFDTIEASAQAEEAWFEHVNQVAGLTIYASMNVKSWYNGANIPGKSRVFMPYIGGFHVYQKKCDEVVEKGYEGFELIQQNGGQ